MKKLLPLLIVLALFASCKVVKQTTTTNTVTHSDTTYKHIELYDTITVQVEDTIRSTKTVMATEFDYDSLNVAMALKDKRIASLVHQLATKTFSTDTVWAHSDFAHARAAVTNNELWVDLLLDSLAYVNSHIQDSTSINTTIETTNNILEEEVDSVWRNPWFYASAFLGLLCLAFIVVILFILIRR